MMLIIKVLGSSGGYWPRELSPAAASTPASWFNQHRNGGWLALRARNILLGLSSLRESVHVALFKARCKVWAHLTVVIGYSGGIIPWHTSTAKATANSPQSFVPTCCCTDCLRMINCDLLPSYTWAICYFSEEDMGNIPPRLSINLYLCSLM